MTKTKILIVEDNPIVAEDIRIKLGHMGYEVVSTATTGEEAIEAADANRPDIALMDIRLGDGMNGIDTASELKRKHQISVIYLTAFADDDTIERAKKTEPYGYIVKPFDDNELKSAIEIANYKQKADRKVKESQQWLETTLKSIGDGVIATDDTGKVVFMNPVAEHLTGWDEADAIGSPVSDVFNIISEITGNIQDDPVARVLKEGIVVGLANHTLLKCKDGRMTPIADSGAPIQDDKGNIIGVVLVFRDQSEEREAQKTLEESERKLSTLIGNLPGMAYRCLNDRNYTMLYISNGCQMVTGYTPWELINNHLVAYNDLIVAEDRESVWFEIQESIKENRSFTLEYRILDKDGNMKWLWEKGICVESQDGSQYVLEGFISDISDLKKTETDALKLAAAIEQADESVEITDADPKIEYVNPAFERITGYKREEIIGRNPRFLQSGKHDEQFYKDLWKKLLDRKVWRGRFQNKRKDGMIFLEDASISPVLDRDGNIINFVAVKRDVTKEIEIERRLQQSLKMEAIGTLAGGVAHDFNNILSSIIGFTELALDETVQGSVQEDNLQEVYAAGKRAKDLVGQILAFARQSEDELKPVQVDLIAKEAMKLIRSSTPATIEIRQNIDSNSLILADPTRIHQVIMNLCTNAVDAMDDGGVLSIELHDEQLNEAFTAEHPDLSPEEYIKLTVSDTGSGIPDELIGSIYEPYFTTKGTGDGTGLGLSTVYGIVKQYNGEILLKTEQNNGSAFTIYLPITKKRKRVKAYQPSRLPTGNEKIIVVDDEVSITKMTSQALSNLGYNITVRTSPIEALELFKSKLDEFDLVITDMTMPNMTGDKLAVELMKIRPDIPVILCTGYSKKISDETAAEIGIKAFAYKPVVKADLAKTVRKVLDEAKE